MSDVRGRMAVVGGDITRLEVDAVVNAANKELAPGGGVAGAIHRAAGPGLWEETRTMGGCETGEAKLSGGHELQASHIIHTVGPVWHGGHEDEDALLRRAYESSLALASEHRLETVAFPALSTGAFGFPVERAQAIAVQTVAAFLERHDRPRRVLFCCFDDAVRQATEAALDRL